MIRFKGLFNSVVFCGLVIGSGCVGASEYLCSAQESVFSPLALPSARSAYVVFNRYLSLPPYNAQIPTAGTSVFDPSLLLSNILIDAWGQSNDTQSIDRYLDYESLSFELPVQIGLGKGWSAGVDLQLGYVSGGFLDPIINGFHKFFGFPDNGRSSLPDNQVLLNLDTNNGVSFHRTTPAFTVSDPVLTVGKNIVQTASVTASLQVELSLPIGLGAGLYGASVPGYGLGGYIDWTPVWWLSADGLIGGLLPGEAFSQGGPSPMLVLRLSFMVDPGWDVVPFLDFNLHTSALHTQVIVNNGVDFFNQPNADLLFGVLIPLHDSARKGEYWAFNVQEDPFLHNTADVSFQANGAFSVH